MREDYVLAKIKDLLTDRGWTLYRLSKESGISYSTLNNTFHRNNVPSISTLLHVCEGFGMTMAEFFNEGGTVVKQLTTTDQQLLIDFHSLKREDKRLVSAYMQGLLKSPSAPYPTEADQAETANQTYSGELSD